VHDGYHLRPEIMESTYYLHHFTRDPKYRKRGEKIFDDFVKYCRVDAGYAALQDVVTKEKRDEMESFALAETFKYFYLLFAPPETEGRLLWPDVSFPRPRESPDEGGALVRIVQSPGKCRLRA